MSTPVDRFLIDPSRQGGRRRFVVWLLVLAVAVAGSGWLVHRQWDRLSKDDVSRAEQRRVGEWFLAMTRTEASKDATVMLRVVSVATYERLTPASSTSSSSRLSLPGTDYAITVVECFCSDTDTRAPEVGIVDAAGRWWASDAVLKAQETRGAYDALDVNDDELKGAPGYTRFAVITPIPEGVRDVRVLLNEGWRPVVVSP